MRGSPRYLLTFFELLAKDLTAAPMIWYLPWSHFLLWDSYARWRDQKCKTVLFFDPAHPGPFIFTPNSAFKMNSSFHNPSLSSLPYHVQLKIPPDTFTILLGNLLNLKLSHRVTWSSVRKRLCHSWNQTKPERNKQTNKQKLTGSLGNFVSSKLPHVGQFCRLFCDCKIWPIPLPASYSDFLTTLPIFTISVLTALPGSAHLPIPKPKPYVLASFFFFF